MRQFNDNRCLDDSWQLWVPELRCKKHEKRSKTFAASDYQVAGSLRYEWILTSGGLKQRLLNVSEFGTDVLLKYRIARLENPVHVITVLPDEDSGICQKVDHGLRDYSEHHGRRDGRRNRDGGKD